MRFEWHSYLDASAAAHAGAARTIEYLDAALESRQRATLALSGGTSPALMFQRLAAAPISWGRVHFFWVDERAVPPTDPESNYRLAAETLLIPARVPAQNIHRVRTELTPQSAATAYEAEIRDFFGIQPGEMPQFDVVHRGMGPDMHTASLFPGSPAIEDREGIAAAVYLAPKAQWRITLLPGPLMAAHNTVMLVTGADKAEAVRAVFQEPYEPVKRPAQLAPAQGSSIEWFLDGPAARFLEPPE